MKKCELQQNFEIFYEFLPNTFFYLFYCGFFFKNNFDKKRLIPMLITALKVIERFRIHIYSIIPSKRSPKIKTARKSRNFLPNIQISEKIEIKKLGSIQTMHHIPISLHVKFQGNRTILQGEKTVTHIRYTDS